MCAQDDRVLPERVQLFASIRNGREAIFVDRSRPMKRPRFQFGDDHGGDDRGNQNQTNEGEEKQ